MTRDELTHLYEQALIDFLENTPCINCGGSEFIAHQNVEQGAFFFVELSERWKDKQAAQMSVAKAEVTCRKKMQRHFNERLPKESWDELKVTSPGDETSDEYAQASAETSSPQTPPPAPSPEQTSQTETPDKGHDPEAPEPQPSPPPPPAKEGQSSDPEKHDQAHESEPPSQSDPSEEASPPQASEGPPSPTRPGTPQ